jgi:hypothetical protein
MSEANPPEEIPKAEHGVAPELIKQLHDRNEKFQRARHQVGKAFKAEINGLTETERALHEVVEAEKEIEKTEEEIQKELKKD